MMEFELDDVALVAEGKAIYGQRRNSYRDLRVWKSGVSLSVAIYRLTEHFPQHEVYGLTSQMRRAAVSIPSNIAEGSSRTSKIDFSRFLTFSLGSLRELETQLIIANELGYVPKDSDLLSECDALTGMIVRLQISLNPKTQDPKLQTDTSAPAVVS